MVMKYLIGIIFIINSETHVEWRTINTDCQNWWKENAIVVPRQNPKRMENRYVILVNHRPVMGYICRG